MKGLRPLLIGGVQTVWNWFKNLLKPVDDVGGKAQDMGRRVGAALGDIIKGVADLPTRFLKLGSQIVDGLVSGVKAKLGEAVAVVGNLGDAVAEKFKSALGIKSPSRVFMGFGDNIAQGAAIGIGRSAGLASQAAAGMASDTAAAAAAQRISAGRAGASGAGAAAGGAGGMTIHFSPTIHVQGGAAEAVKGQVTEALNLSLRELEQLIARVSAQQARRAY